MYNDGFSVVFVVSLATLGLGLVDLLIDGGPGGPIGVEVAASKAAVGYLNDVGVGDRVGGGGAGVSWLSACT